MLLISGSRKRCYITILYAIKDIVYYFAFFIYLIIYI